MHKKIFILFMASCTLLFSGCTSQTKKESINSALKKRSQEKIEKTEKTKNDKINPKIFSTHPEQEYTVDQTIDYDRILSTLTAEDDVDGDITEKIWVEKSNIKQHNEGNYSIVYKVLDNAGNEGELTISVTIVSKYDTKEKNRLMNSHLAYKKILEEKNLTDIYISNIITNEEGNNVILEYSGDNQNGEFVDGRMAYFNEEKETLDLDESLGYPSGFDSKLYEYDFEELEDFEKYYHLKID